MPRRSAPPVAGYLAVPPSGKGRPVLVLHAWWGLNDFIRGLCDRLAAEGFVALAPDLYEGRVAKTIAGAKRLRDAPLREPTQDTLMRAIEQLKAHPAVRGDKIGVIGFSMGAYWALRLAQRARLPIAAVAVFYGTGATGFTRSRAAFQGHFAEHDEFEPEAVVKGLKESLERANRPVEFFVYPGAGHWFFESDRADAYDASAAELAWKRTLAFLRRHTRSSPLRRRAAATR